MALEEKPHTLDSTNLLMSLLSEPIMCSFVNDDLVPGLESKPPVYKKLVTNETDKNLQLDLNLYTIPETSSEEQSHRSDDISNDNIKSGRSVNDALSTSSGFLSETNNESRNYEDITLEDIEDEMQIDDVEKQTDMILQDLQKEQLQLNEIVSDLDKLFSEGEDVIKSRSDLEKSCDVDLEPVLDGGYVEPQSKLEAATFSDIVTILEELEKDGSSTVPELKFEKSKKRSKNVGRKKDLSSPTCKDYSDLLTYLDEIDQSCISSIDAAKRRVQTITDMASSVSGLRLDVVPKLDDLLQHTNLELANYVIDLSMRLEDKTSSVALLKSEVSKLHQLIANSEQDRDRIVKQKLQAEKNKYEPVIKRHQTFIDQLIADKKELNDKCERLMSELKTAENRHARNIQAAEQRHKVELKRCREIHEASEKTKREKWMELKTNRIKEMTAKSVEHEITSMTEKYQKDIFDLKMSHKNEIEDLELRAARKTQQQCEALREQLTTERECAIANEREALKQRFEKLVESEERGYQEQKRRMKEDHANKMEELHEKERQLESEKEAQVRAVREECEEKLETAKRRHDAHVANIKESMRLELEMWRNNYIKQQSCKLSEAEQKLRETCRKERDREIEMVIDRLERESEQTKRELELSSENRLRRLKEKFEEDINLLRKEEKEYRARQEMMKSELLIQEETIRKLKTTLSDVQDERIHLQKMSDKLSVEKRNLREIIRQEFISEINHLKGELGLMTTKKEKELQDIYLRVKSSIARKDQQITKVTEDNIALHEKCKLLENMLEQQRRDFLIR